MADENTVGIQELVKQLWDVAASAYQDSLPQGTNAASSSSANAMQSFLGARGVDPALSRELIDSVARALVQVASPTNINLEQAPFYQELTGILGRLPADSPAFGQPRQDGPAPNAGPGNSPPGNTPPGNTPPGNTPPGNSAPGNTPPGNSAPGNSPLGNSPSSNSALGNTPPGNTLPGITPPANSPPGTTPTGTTGLGNTGPGNPPAAPGPLSESTATTAERIITPPQNPTPSSGGTDSNTDFGVVSRVFSGTRDSTIQTNLTGTPQSNLTPQPESNTVRRPELATVTTEPVADLGSADDPPPAAPDTPEVIPNATVELQVDQTRAEEGTSGTNKALTYTITRSNTLSATTVDWQISGVDASDLAPGQAMSGTVSLSVGQASATLTVQVAGDQGLEANENLLLTLLNPGDSLVLGAVTAANTEIINDDGTVELQVSQSSIEEGSSGSSKTLTYTVTRTNTVNTSSIDWTLSGSFTAEDLLPGQATSGTLSFAVGQASRSFTVEVLGDKLIEASENITATLSNPGDNLKLGTVTAVSTEVINDDGTVDLQVSQTSIEEGTTGTSKTLTYTVTRSNTVSASSVDWQMAGVEAADLVSGQAMSGTLNFVVGQASTTFAIEFNGDKSLEATENLQVSLVNPGNNLLLGAASPAATEVLTDDGTVELMVSQTSIEEGTAGTSKTLTYTVTRTNTVNTSSVDWALAGSFTAEDLLPGQATTGTLTFAVGQASRSFTVEVQGDKLIEASENITATLSNPGNNLSLGTVTAVSTEVINDDGTVDLQVSQTSIEEGTTGTSKTLTYTVTRSNTVSATSVGWQIGGVDAADLAPGQAMSGILSLTVGQASTTFTVEVTGDKGLEATENLQISLVNPGDNLNLGTVPAVGTEVITDDGTVDIKVSQSSIEEGTAGTSKTLTYTVTRTNTVNTSSIDWALTGTFDAEDLVAGQATSGTLSFAVGEASRTFTVEVLGDKLIEASETITAALSVPGDNLNLGAVTAVSTEVINDDGTVDLQVSQTRIEEGSSGTSKTLTYTVTRTNTVNTSSIDWALSGTLDADDQVAGQATTGTLAFAVGQASRSFTVEVLGDKLIEANENITATISNPGDNLNLGTVTTVGTEVINDDGTIELQVDQTRIEEGTSGTSKTLTYTVTRTNTVSTTSVGWQISGVDAADLASGQALSGTLNLAVGQASTTFTVVVAGDKSLETTENLQVSLVNPGDNLNLGTVTAVSTEVINDDATVDIQVNQTSIEEGTVGTSKTLTYTVTRSNTVSPTSVGWQIGGVDAADLAQGQAMSGVLSLIVGQASTTFTVVVTGDKSLEATENLQISLINPGDNLNLGTSSIASTEVITDDGTVEIQVSQTSIEEGTSDTSKKLTYTVTRTNTVNTSSIDWALSGTFNAEDLVSGQVTSDTLAFAVGQASRTFTVGVLGDKLIEASETITATISKPGDNLNLGTVTAVSTEVVNDDGTVDIQVSQTSIEEGTDGTSKTLTYTVTRTNTVNTSSIDWALTGTFNADDLVARQATTGTLAFAVGQASRTFTVGVLGDKLIEASETITATLSKPGDNLNLGTITAVSTEVINDDGTVDLQVSKTSIEEGSSGTSKTLTYTVTRTNTVSTTSVGWQISGVDAADLASGQTLSGTLNLAVGQASTTFTVEVAGDKSLETSENLQVSLVNLGDNLNLGTVTAVSTEVITDDGTVDIQVSQTSIEEGTAGTSKTLTYTVTRTNTVNNSSINWALTGTFNAEDLVAGQATTGTLAFAVGQASRTFTVEVLGDKLIEASETITATISKPGDNLNLGTVTAVSTEVINDDGTVGLVVELSAIEEGTTGTSKTLTYTVTRDNSVSSSSVDWQISGVDAADLASALTGTVNMAIGQTKANFTVEVNGDRTIESAETLVVKLLNPGANLNLGSPTEASTAISNDDGLVGVTASSLIEGGNGASQTLTFTLTRENTRSASAVDWALTGIDPARFNGTLPSGTTTFAAGEAVKTVSFAIVGDRFIEQDEHWLITLSRPGDNLNLNPASTSATGLVRDDDALVSVTARVADVAEGQEGSSQVIEFLLTRTNALASTSVDWTVAGTDIDATDFGGTMPSGSTSFAIGELEKLVSVTLKGDRTIETNEGLTLKLSNPGANLSISVGEATTSVRNDDIGFSVMAHVTDVVEGGASSQTAVSFYVVRSDSLNQAMSIDYRIIPLGGNAADGLDFVGGQDTLVNNDGRPSGVVSFSASETRKLVTLQVAGDAVDEVNEGFSVVLTNAPAGTQILFGETTGQIRSDELKYSISPVAASAFEGNNGLGNNLRFLVTRVGDLSTSSSVGYDVVGYGENAADTTDFNGALSGTVMFAAGEASKTITVQLSGDATLEGFEGVLASLRSLDSNTILTTVRASATIDPDDPIVSIVADNAMVKEGSGSTTRSHTFEVSRTEFINEALSVGWQLVASGGNPVNAADFGGTLPSGQIVFASGESSKTLSVTPSADTDIELGEGYEVVLTADNLKYTLQTARASGMVLNDDVGLTLVASNLDRAEGNPGDSTQLAFTVQRSGDVTSKTQVHWELVAGNTHGVTAADFAGNALPSGDITFTRGLSSLSVNLPLLSVNNLLEADKTFSIRLSNPNPAVGTHLLVSEVNGFIRNDDATFALVAGAPSFEGHNDSSTASFVIERQGDLTGTDTVDYTVSAASAGDSADASDFLSARFPSGTVTFQANEASKTINLSIQGDSTRETDESYTVTLGHPGLGSTIVTGTVQMQLRNDDDQLSLSAAAADASESADGSSRDLSFTVQRSGFVDRTSSVAWSVAGLGASAANATDFVGGTLPTGTVNFAANETSKTITVQVRGDYAMESDEGFRVTLASPSAGTELLTLTADGVIRNDDTGLAIATTTTHVAEGLTGHPSTQVFTVTRTGIVTGSTSVDWSVAASGQKPVDATDFGGTLPSGTVTFAANETSKTIEIQVAGDLTVEDDETFSVSLANASGHADIMTSTAQGDIVTDDIGVAISAVTATTPEGGSGSSRDLQFTVTRSGDVTSAFSIHWSASGMDAADFVTGTALADTLSFSANQTSKTITLTVAGDNTDEPNEVLLLTLDNPVGNPANSRTVILGATASSTVTDDDTRLVLTAPTASSEGNGSGTATPLTFTITRDGDTSVAGSVDWLVELPGGSTSSAANDFVAGQDALSRNNGLPSGNVSFSAGQASQTLTVNIATDGKVERDETFRVVLQNGGSNVDVAPGVATATVTNDDTGFSVEAVDTSKSEGQSGTTTYSFSVTRAGAISQAATVAWALTGSGSNPVNAADFGGSLPSGTVSFAANELSKTLEISVAGDTSVEFDEGFTVTISNARLADTSLQTIVDASATGLIRNDDQSFVVSAANALITEGNSGNRTVLFDVTRTGVLAGAVSVAYSVTGGTGTDAADLASSPLPSGTLNFADGIAQQQISFDVRGDTLAEGDEVYTLSLSNPSAGTLATASGTASIVNDDTNFVLVAPSNTSEGTSGTTAVQFTVTRTGVTTGTGSVNWKLVGTAAGLSTADFVGNQDTLSNNGGMPSGTVSFLANQTSKTITLNVQGDTGVENDETLQILLSSPIGGVIEGTDGDKSALLLTDDDAFSLSPAAESRAEGHSDNTMSYTVLRTGSLTGARNLTWTVTGANGFATGTDLATGQAASGTVSFAEGQTSATISITLKGDTVVETDETMTMTLSAAPANSTITTAATSTNITNDDASFAIAPLVASAVEGNSGYVDLTYKVTRSGFLNQSNTVTWSMDATANPSVNSSDFYFSQPSGYRDASNLPYGSLVFYTGETEKTITLRMAGDSNYEPNEIPRVALSVPSTGSIVGTATADGTLTNDDAEFNITASPAASFFEGDGGTSGVVMTYTITRTGNLNQANTVNWSVGGSGANYANYLDFIDPTTLTFYKYYNIYGSYSDSGGRYDRKTPDGTVSFAANESSKTISFRISGDTGGGSVEPDEGFTLSLNTPSSGSSLGANMQTSHTILNDDTRMTLSVDDYSKAESVTGTNTTYNYTITRSGYLGHSTGYSWSVGGVGNTVLDYTQSSRAEYSAGTDDFASNTYPSGSGSFAANDTTKTFSITALGDDTPEDDQWFSANLSGTSGSDEIYVIYDNPSSYTNSTLFGLQYANDVRDSVAASGSSLYTSIERDEAVFELYSQEVYSESQYASGMSSRAEGDTVSDGGSNSSNDLVEHIFRIDRTIAQSGTASVGWYVEAIPRTQAEIDSNTVRNDYANAADFAGNSNPLNYSVALASGTVNFADGQRYGYIKFYSQADNVGELDEFYRVNLTSASAGSSISTDKSQATPMLANDDTRFTFAASTGNLTEGSSATYTVTRVGDTRGSDTVDWSLALSNEVSNEGNTNSATWYRLDASDIETPVTSSGTPSLNGSTWSGTLTFADGVSTQTVVVKTVDDSYSETWREDFTFNFSNPQNPHLSETRDDQETPTTIGQTLRFDKTVYDNDPDPLITVSSNLTSVIEGSSSTSHQVPFTITRTDQSGRDGTLQYSTTVALSYYYNGGGVAYTASTVTFGAGETTKQVTATVSGSDYVDTSSRYVSVTALSASSALALQVPSDGYGPANVGSPSSASVQLTDDDIQLWVNSFGVVNPFVASPATINAYEGTPLTFNVVRRGLSSTPVTVSYTLTTGTAGSSDVTGVTSGSFTIPSMSLSYALTLPQELVDDTTVEGLENFVLTLTAPTDVSGTTVRFLAKSDDLSTTPTSSQAFTVNLYDNDNTYTVSAPGSTNESTPGYSSTAFNFGVTRTSTGYSGSTNLSNIKWKVESVGANGVTSADFSTSDALGTNGGLPSGTLNGIYSTGTITVNVRGDSTVEPDEQFRVVLFEETLTTPTPDLVKSLNVASGSATIANDDTGISIADATVTETDADQTITFTVTRNGVLTRTSSVNWIASGISAAFDSDFAGTTSGTLSFASGETTKTITLTVKGDVSPEATETFTVGLSTLNNIEDPIDISAIGTIRNDDNSFAVSAGTPSLEGSAQVFTVTRVRDTVQDQTITWAVSLPTGSTATAADFNNSLPSGSVTFAPGELSKTFNVTAFDDTANETEETYSVGISLGTGTTGDVITTATASGSLRDNDALFSITANAAAKLEGNSASTAFTFAVDSISGTGSVEWRLSSTTATASDFSTPDSLGNNGGLPSGTLVFSGTATQTLTIAVVGDTTVEQDEPFTVTLSNPAGGLVVSPTTASSTITTDESSVVLSALNAVRAEGNSGSTPFTFKVTRTGAIGDATTVAYAVTGSGTNPANAADFGSSLPSGSLSLPANQAETTLTINVNGDLLGEADEEFTVTLSNPAAGLTIAGATASGTLQTDDVVFDVQAPATRAEGNAGATTLFDFVVTRSGNLTGAQTLNWSVAGTGADPTDSSDFDAVSGSVEFAANDTSKTISVPVKGDLLGEAHEGFRLSLTGPSGVVFTHAFADAVITDDEASLRVAATDSNKLEGASGTTTHTFTVTRSGNTAVATSVDWAVQAGNGLDASDFAGGVLPSGTLQFASEVNTATISVQVAGDTVVEANETLSVSLSNPGPAAVIVAGSANGSIVSEDMAWTVTAIDAAEGDSTINTKFRIERSGGVLPTSIDWSVSASGTDAASASDFFGAVFASGNLSFAQGVSSQEVSLAVAGDSVREGDETYLVTLTAPTDSHTHSYTRQSHTGTLQNDDDVMSVAALAAENAENGANPSFTVTRSGSLTGTSSVGWQISHGSTLADDFTATSGIVNFADGQSSAVLTLSVAGERTVETDETFSVQLTHPGSGSSLDPAASSASGILRNDDVDLSVAAGTGVEGDDGAPGQASFTVTRSGDLSGSTSVDWRVQAGTALAADFANAVLPSGTLSFASGESSKNILVALAGDGVQESNETFTLQLSNASSHADLVSTTANGSIQDDDDTLTVVAQAGELGEGDSGSTAFTYRIDRSGSSIGTASVTWNISGAGAHATTAADFEASSGTVTLADGESSKTFSVQVKGEQIGEYDEGFALALTNPSFGSVAAATTASGTIRNDDPVLLLRASQTSGSEGADGAETPFTFTVVRSGNITLQSSVQWQVVRSGTRPVNAMDFGGELPSGELVFGAGVNQQQLVVNVLGDAVGEFDKTFSLVLSTPVDATILEGSIENTIRDDDTGVSLVAVDADKLEGNTGVNTNFSFRVERMGALDAATIQWQTQGSGSYPVNADDFVGGAFPSGTINFAQNEVSRDIVLQVAGDNAPGQNQSFKVVLTGNYLINREVSATIRNDDSLISVSAQTPTLAEGNAGESAFSFVVSRTGATDLAASVDWRVAGSGGHQANAADFVGNVLPSGSVQFNAGEASKTVTVRVAGDTLTEVDEAFSVQLVNPGSGVSIDQNTAAASATIQSDDQGVVLIGLDVERKEGTAGTQTAMNYQVFRSGNISADITLNYTVSGRVDSNDFVSPLTGSFTMAAGVSSHLLSLNVRGDATLESDETFQVALSGAGINFDSAAVSGVIKADEEGFSVAARQTTVSEGTGSGARQVIFDITASGITSASTVNWSLVSTGQNAVTADDFVSQTLPSGSHVFNSNATQTVTLELTQDASVEFDEAITLGLDTTSALPLLVERATSTLANDDLVGAGDDRVEGNAGSDTQLSGQQGNDSLFGYGSGDVLDGGEGNDVLHGGSGADILIGGSGADRFVFQAPGEGVDILKDFEPGVDQIGYASGQFGTVGATLSSVAQAFDTNVATTLAQLAARADAEVYKVSFAAGNFAFATGAQGQLDELEATMTQGNHTGSAFFLISDGATSRLYFDADTNLGSDGSGLVALAELPTISSAHTTPDLLVQHAS